MDNHIFTRKSWCIFLSIMLILSTSMISFSIAKNNNQSLYKIKNIYLKTSTFNPQTGEPPVKSDLFIPILHFLILNVYYLIIRELTTKLLRVNCLRIFYTLEQVH